MKKKTKTLFAERMMEIFPEAVFDQVLGTDEFTEVCRAVENGQPFLIRQLAPAEYEFVIQPIQ